MNNSISGFRIVEGKILTQEYGFEQVPTWPSVAHYWDIDTETMLVWTEMFKCFYFLKREEICGPRLLSTRVFKTKLGAQQAYKTQNLEWTDKSLTERGLLIYGD